MKGPVSSLFVLAGLFATLSVAPALPPDLSPPPTAFGDADRDGTLLVTDDLREADFGGGLRLPVRWIYHSSDQGYSPYGWDGFSLTLLESKAVKQTAVLYKVTLLCEKAIYFNKQTSGTPAWKSKAPRRFEWVICLKRAACGGR